MLKMFHNQAHAGSSPDFWEDNWAAADFERSVRFSAVDPLRPLFEKYLKQDSLMLEGGCGVGNYIGYYDARGFRVIGLDFAQKALDTLHRRAPHLKLSGGDVSKMPFADETFDLYYSGGVVEHFEGGADAALDEARRVLRNDGILLISVPYYNPLRKILMPFRKLDWKVVDRASVDERSEKDRQFFQYAYTRPEFISMLDNAGLVCIETQGYAVTWGLYELPFLNSNGGGEFAVEPGPRAARPVVEKIDLQPLARDPAVPFLKRLVVSEDASIPLLGLGVKALRWAAANMMMYVCRRK
ncbi:MAG: methyltransferase domain-containing protein [Pyrinomonadaceae bacterium]